MVLTDIDTLIPAPEDAVVYNIIVDEVSLSANASGDVTCSLKCHVNRTEGSKVEERVMTGSVTGRLSTDNAFTALSRDATGYWRDNGAFNVSRSTAPATLTLRYVSGNIVLATKELAVSRQGRTGQGYYPAGEYTSKEYTRTERAAPVVHYKDASTDEYWYLDADTNMVNGVPVAPSDTTGNPWKRAENFGVVLTNAVFSSFANMGGFVINGDYWFSRYGTLYHKSSNTVSVTVINADNVDTLFGGAVAYTYFDDTDPAVDTDPAANTYKFRPTKAINAVTGEEIMAGGKIRVKANGDVEFSEEVRAKALETVAGNGVRTKISGGIMQIFGLSGVPNWVFGVDDTGAAVLEYHNNAGQKMYDLGATGITDIDQIAETVNENDRFYFNSNSALRNVTTLDGSVISAIYGSTTILKDVFKQRSQGTTLYVYGARKTRTGSTFNILPGTYASTVAKAGAADNKAFFAIADIENGTVAKGVYFDVDQEFLLMDEATWNRLGTDQKAAIKATYYDPWASYYPSSGTYRFVWGRFPVYVRRLCLVRAGIFQTTHIYILCNFKF